MDWKKSKITYSKGITEMFGYTKDEFNMNVALNNIHPEDKKIVHRVIRGLIQHSINTSLSGGNQYLKLTYRSLKKDGTYIKVLRQSSPYQIDVDGKFISNMTFLTDISFMTSNDNKVEWHVFSDEMDMSKFKAGIYKEFINFFTKRELQVIALIQHHFTNKEIAARLFISAHTVVSHRKNILKKSNCSNAKELLEFCKLNGILG